MRSDEAAENLYDVLGVRPDASHAEIRRVYLDLARSHHPDLRDGDPAAQHASQRRMQELNEAWSVLGDESRRRAYDEGLARPGARPVVDPGPRRGWTPVEPLDPDEPDPRDLVEDVPIGDGARIPGLVQVGPATLLLIAVLLAAVGLVTGLAPLLILAAVAGALGGVGFLAVPFVAVMRSRRSELSAEHSRGSG